MRKLLIAPKFLKNKIYRSKLNLEYLSNCIKYLLNFSTILK